MHIGFQIEMYKYGTQHFLIAPLITSRVEGWKPRNSDVISG
jgi:hypothetical protein